MHTRLSLQIWPVLALIAPSMTAAQKDDIRGGEGFL